MEADSDSENESVVASEAESSYVDEDEVESEIDSLDDLQKESEMPIEELMKLYGNKQDDTSHINPSEEVDEESNSSKEEFIQLLTTGMKWSLCNDGF